jgi:hypothetical protein
VKRKNHIGCRPPGNPRPRSERTGVERTGAESTGCAPILWRRERIPCNGIARQVSHKSLSWPRSLTRASRCHPPIRQQSSQSVPPVSSGDKWGHPPVPGADDRTDDPESWCDPPASMGPPVGAGDSWGHAPVRLPPTVSLRLGESLAARSQWASSCAGDRHPSAARGDSAWEDGGSAVLQVPVLQPVVRFSQRRRVGSLSGVVHRVGPLIRERWITKPAICVSISFFWCGCRSGRCLAKGGVLRGAKRSRGRLDRCST